MKVIGNSDLLNSFTMGLAKEFSLLVLLEVLETKAFYVGLIVFVVFVF